MADNNHPQATLPEPEALVPNEVLEKAKNEKVIEELKQLKKTTAKTDVEIEKLNAELRQLTQPLRSPQFYFSFISALAAMGAIWGILLQHNWRELQSQVQEQELRRKEADLRTKDSEIDKKDAELAAKILEHKKEKELLKDDLAEATMARKNEEKLLIRYAALAAVVIASVNNKGTMELDNPEQNRLIDSLAQGDDDYFFLAAILKRGSLEAKTLSVLVLSRLDKEKIGPWNKRTQLATILLTCLLTEEDLRIKRLATKAIGRLGRHAVPPLLEKLEAAQAEARLNIIRALGDAGPDAPARVVSALLPILADNNKVLQRQVVAALGAIGPAASQAEPTLVGLLPASTAGLLQDSDSYFLCKEIISSFGKMGIKDTQTIPRLTTFFDIDDPSTPALADELRGELVVTCGKIGFNAKAAAPKILDIIKRDRRKPVTEQAAFALGSIGSVDEIDWLLYGAQPPLPKPHEARFIAVGLLAMSALTSNATRKATLDKWLISEEQPKEKGKVRVPASALSSNVFISLRNRGKDSVPFFIDLVNGFQHLKNDFIREDIVVALGNFGKGADGATKALIAALDDRNIYVQIAAIKALGKIDSQAPEVRAAIQHAFESSENQQVKAAAQSARLVSAPLLLDRPGMLTAADDKVKEKHYKAFPVRFEKDRTYRIDLMSSAFDAFIYVKEGGNVVAFDDDGGDGLNARLFFEPPHTGDYQVWATTYAPGTTGAFKLEIRQSEKTRPAEKK